MRSISRSLLAWSAKKCTDAWFCFRKVVKFDYETQETRGDIGYTQCKTTLWFQVNLSVKLLGSRHRGIKYSLYYLYGSRILILPCKQEHYAFLFDNICKIPSAFS